MCVASKNGKNALFNVVVSLGDTHFHLSIFNMPLIDNNWPLSQNNRTILVFHAQLIRRMIFPVKLTEVTLCNINHISLDSSLTSTLTTLLIGMTSSNCEIL